MCNALAVGTLTKFLLEAFLRKQNSTGIARRRPCGGLSTAFIALACQVCVVVALRKQFTIPLRLILEVS